MIKKNKLNRYEKFINENIDRIDSLCSLGGMTNKNFLIDIDYEKYVLRIPGYNTDYLINRFDEKYNSELIKVLSIDTDVFYFNEFNGIKISKFIYDSFSLTPTYSKLDINMDLTTNILRKLHNSNLRFINNFNVFDKILNYEKIINIDLNNIFYDYNTTRLKVFSLEKKLNILGIDLKPCHNDTIPENFIKDNKGKLYLIDWEYSGMNDPMWDIAAHTLESCFSREEEILFVQKYFKCDHIKQNYYIKIDIFKICQDFLWSLWSVIKSNKNNNLFKYGLDRYDRAKRNLDIFYCKYNV